MNQLTEQQHHELQLDALREVCRKRQLELNELKLASADAEKSIHIRRKAVEGKLQTVQALQQHLNRMSQLLIDNAARVSYERDYEQRQQYYKYTDPSEVDAKAFRPLSAAWRSYRGVIVSPDGLRFQNGRIQSALRALAGAGFLCIAFNQEVGAAVEPSAEEGYYEFRDEIMLLNWLTEQGIKPIVLCTWVLQSSWFDLLDSATIWYDICEHEDVLWGMDASARLKHYDLLKQSTVVTYSDKKWKRYAGPRKDAVYLDSDGIGEAVIRLSGSLEV
ncbi:hypothetical protein PAECIP111893_05036 [Paenibacillus plantiphilus]|uniref:Uncharacterized protein n=1 Tax=Paenibacillus plantiphilus TaxID=2905650 RepID=A0ABM9CVB3_9BACL|nr:hypothetical protein [Paenibacillus plantiphilus]CAH1223737.1 hypothetical protein PAECIP111893_05036 [Paenibacillus plantiphilus]